MKSYSAYPNPIYFTKQRWPDCDGLDFFRTILIPHYPYRDLVGLEISDIFILPLINLESIDTIQSNNFELDLSLMLLTDLESVNDSVIEILALAIDVISINDELLLISNDIELADIYPIQLISIDDSVISIDISYSLDVFLDEVSSYQVLSTDSEYGAIELNSFDEFNSLSSLPIIILINNIILTSTLSSNNDVDSDLISSDLTLLANIEFNSIDTQNGIMLSQISYVELDQYPSPYDINDWHWWFLEINGPW